MIFINSLSNMPHFRITFYTTRAFTLNSFKALIAHKPNMTWRWNLHQSTTLDEVQKALEAHDCKPSVANLSIAPHTLGIPTTIQRAHGIVRWKFHLYACTSTNACWSVFHLAPPVGSFFLHCERHLSNQFNALEVEVLKKEKRFAVGKERYIYLHVLVMFYTQTNVQNLTLGDCVTDTLSFMDSTHLAEWPEVK